MNTTEFVNKFNTLRTDKDKEIYLNSILSKKYIQFFKKIEICKEAIRISDVIYKDIPNNIVAYVYFIMLLIDNYTVINVVFENVFDEYDKLRSSETLHLILSLIPEDEISELNLIKESL